MKKIILVLLFVLLAGVYKFTQTNKQESLSTSPTSEISNEVIGQTQEKTPLTAEISKETISEKPNVPLSYVAKAEPENDINLENIISQLNGDEITLTERRKLFNKLEELDRLEIREIETKLESIKQEFAILADSHQKRLESYGLRP